MKGLQRSMGRGNAASQEVIKQSLKISSLPITVSGATGVGFGSAVFSDFPEGNILLLGAVSYLTITKDATATGVIDTFAGNYAIGSAPTADATLAGADIDLIPSTALSAATAGVSPTVRGTNATQVILDNTDGSLELNLNLLIDDASISANTQLLSASGYLHIAYIILGDD